MSEAELDELPNADAVAKIVLVELKQDDWQRQFEAITNMRRLIKHHAATLKKFNFQGMMTELIKLMENLRSGLAKNSLLAVFEASQIFKRELDA